MYISDVLYDTRIKNLKLTLFTEIVHGKWSSWDPYSACSVTCGNGTKTRRRRCDNPSPAYSGRACAGSSSETTSCFIKHCRGKEYEAYHTNY